MNITFQAKGLSLEADVKYYSGRPAKLYGLPENCYEEEHPEIEFNTLTCEGENAMFLCDANFLDEIEKRQKFFSTRVSMLVESIENAFLDIKIFF